MIHALENTKGTGHKPEVFVSNHEKKLAIYFIIVELDLFLFLGGGIGWFGFGVGVFVCVFGCFLFLDMPIEVILLLCRN